MRGFVTLVVLTVGGGFAMPGKLLQKACAGRGVEIGWAVWGYCSVSLCCVFFAGMVGCALYEGCDFRGMLFFFVRDKVIA